MGLKEGSASSHYLHFTISLQIAWKTVPLRNEHLRANLFNFYRVLIEQVDESGLNM